MCMNINDEEESSTPDAFDEWWSDTHGGTDNDMPDYDIMGDSRE